MIDLHQLISGNVASVASNLEGFRNRYLALAITVRKYTKQTGYVFLPLHNPCHYTPTIGIDQEQALRNERFQQNQALFRRYTAVGGIIKK